MKKWHKVAILAYVTGMTALVIKQAFDIYFLTDAVHSILKVIDQEQVDRIFYDMVEDLDDPTE